MASAAGDIVSPPPVLIVVMDSMPANALFVRTLNERTKGRQGYLFSRWVLIPVHITSWM
jgi:hypothetical protein